MFFYPSSPYTICMLYHLIYKYTGMSISPLSTDLSIEMEHQCENCTTDSEYEYSSDSYSSFDEDEDYYKTHRFMCSECGALHTSKTYYQCAMCGVVVCCFCFNRKADDSGYHMRLDFDKGHRIFTCTKLCFEAHQKR